MADVQVVARAGVIKSSLLTMVAIAALGITRLIHLSLVGRNVSLETFELVGVLISATMTAGLFLPGGLASAAAKFIAYQEGRGDPQAARAVYRRLEFAGYLISAALATAVGLGLGVHYGLSFADAFSVALLTFAFSVYSIEKSAFYGFHRVAAYVRLEILGAVVAIGSTIVVIAAGWTAYLLPLTLGYSVLILGAWFVLRRRGPRATSPGASLPAASLPGASLPGASLPGASLSGASLPGASLPRREIVEYVGLASVGGLAAAGLLQALPMLAGFLRVDVSAFATAVGLVAPLYFLPRALGMALFPAMANAHGAGDIASVRKQADVSTRGLFVLLAPCFVAGILLSRQVLVVVFGPSFAGGATVLQILLAATFLMVTQVAAVNALSSGPARAVRIPVGSAVAGGVTGVLAAIPLGLALGEIGVALAYLLAAVISASGPLVATARRHALTWTGTISRSVAVVAAAVLAATLLNRAGATWPVDILAALAGAALAAALLRRDIQSVLAARH